MILFKLLSFSFLRNNLEETFFLIK